MIICFPVVHQLLVFSSHSCQFTVLWDVEFLCFMILSTSSFCFTLGCLPSVTRSLIAQATCYPLRILHVHTISTRCFPCFVGNKQFCVSYLLLFLMITLLSWVIWRFLQITNKNFPGHSQSQFPLKKGLIIKKAELLPFSSYHVLSIWVGKLP
jgi:hypothetical protein